MCTSLLGCQSRAPELLVSDLVPLALRRLRAEREGLAAWLPLFCDGVVLVGDASRRITLLLVVRGGVSALGFLSTARVSERDLSRMMVLPCIGPSICSGAPCFAKGSATSIYAGLGEKWPGAPATGSVNASFAVPKYLIVNDCFSFALYNVQTSAPSQLCKVENVCPAHVDACCFRAPTHACATYLQPSTMALADELRAQILDLR